MKAVMLDAASLGDDIDLAPLAAACDELIVHDHTRPEQCVERLAGAQIAISNKVVLDRITLESLPELRLICVMATGTNNIDSQAAAEAGITVRNITGYGTASVAQHTLMMMLALANRLPLYQRDLAAGLWQQSPAFCLMNHRTLQLECKHLVIVGQGELGTHVAKLATAFGMHVSFTARPGKSGKHKTDTRPTLQQVAPSADIISLHCPLTDDTRHLVDDSLIRQLKPQALLINCSRGGIIDDRAALIALRENRIGGFATDVLPEEPPRHGHELLDALEQPLNLIVTPHNAWISPEARQRVIELTARNMTTAF